jgi:hypothetical protein
MNRFVYARNLQTPSLKTEPSRASGFFLIEMRLIQRKSMVSQDMTLLGRLLVLPLLMIGACAALSSDPENIRLEFVHPDRFTDFRIQGRQEIASTQIFRDQVSSYLSPVVAKRFPGATLSLKFTDIHLAGRYEPSRIRNFNNVRFDRDIASPMRLEFQYALVDRKGTVITSGSKSLVESEYLRRYINYPDSEKVSTLFYEKVTLARWLSSLAPSGSTFAGK